MSNLLLLSALFLHFLQQGSTSKKLPGVEQYEIVYPRKLHAVQKRDTERHKETKLDDTMEYGIKANGEEVILHLQKNKHLLAPDYTETIYSDAGQQITTSPQIKDHCYYEGYVQNDADSRAAISACKGLSGYFETRGQKYLIEPLGTSDRDEHAVYKYEKLQQKSLKTCGLINNTWEVDSDDPINDIFKSSNSPEVSTQLRGEKRNCGCGRRVSGTSPALSAGTSRKQLPKH
ncbi:ADAM DEC1 [Heliangelus exortis]|uniref:ADAM DEC1 n=1 Tax=Heliangelus exortis TaxID=472823 RepID=UPI003A8F6FE7